MVTVTSPSGLHTYRASQRTMSDAPDKPVLDYLRMQFGRVDQRFDTLERKANETITRVSAVERDIAALKVDFQYADAA